jgi:lysyl-tRNA synthetase class I
MSITAIIITAFGIIWSLFLAPLIVKLLKKYNMDISNAQLEALKNLIIEAIQWVEEYCRNRAKANEPIPNSEAKKAMAMDYIRDHMSKIEALKDIKFDTIKPIISDKINAFVNEIRR